jgi:AAA+ superfamily predicted ATPase
VQQMTDRSPSISVEYTLACLARLDLQIRREVVRFRLMTGERPDEDLRGLYISDEEVNALLEGQIQVYQLIGPAALPEEALKTLERAELAVRDQIAHMERQAGENALELRLQRVVELFGLSDLEREVLIICLAPEVDLKYERYYGYLQDDVTKKRPTLDLVMRLLCTTFEERLAVRRAFEPGAALLEWDLVSLHDDPGSRRPVLPARYLKLDERIAGYLLGSDQIDGRLQALVDPQAVGPGAGMPDEVKERLENWISAWERTWNKRAPVMLLHGRYGSGRHAAVHTLASGLGKPCLMFSTTGMIGGGLRADQAVRLAEREALLCDGIVCWSQIDDLIQPDGEGELSREHNAFIHTLASGRNIVVLLGGKSWEPGRQLGGRPFLRLGFPESTYIERKSAWSERLNGSSHLTEAEISSLAGRFRLTPGQIRDAVGRAQTLMWARDPSSSILMSGDIDAASRDQSQSRLGTLARKLIPRYQWDDIVLPRQQLATLHMICATIRQRPTVYGDWGFDRKLSLGKGLIALFSGPSGTGKTMSAEIIAQELGLDLYKINLSAVVSKYIGETEKNLEHIFGEAQDSDAILFFDEADALFGKRSEVKDAHDRYANIETAYLLQRTEEYSGLVILASNIKKNMDEAFIRRIHFMLDFPFPEEAERLEIWRRTFPLQAPQAADIDLPFLSRKLKISGGNIRNIILTAAFLAAEDQAPIGMRHLVRGASYEYQKMGKMIVEGDFEQYFEHARG